MRPQLDFEVIHADYCRNKLNNPRLAEAGYAVQRILRIAYTRSLEVEQEVYKLPTNTIREHIADENDPNKVEAQIDRIRQQTIDKDAIYTLAREDGEPTAFVKVLPINSKLRQGLGLEPSTYLNDIASVYGRQGVGSMALVFALWGWPENRPIILDSFDGNTVANDWFDRLGFQPVRDQPPDLAMRFGPTIEIPRTRMGAPKLKKVVEALNASLARDTDSAGHNRTRYQ